MIAIWIIGIAVLAMTAPSMGELVRDQGQPDVPHGYPSKKASHMLEQMHKQEGSEDTSSTALVFHKDGIVCFF